jgi:hypothetical protein
MSIPRAPAPPSLPLGPLEYDRRYQDQYSNVLRLYFNQIQNVQQEITAQVATNQTNIWLMNSGGMFSG